MSQTMNYAVNYTMNPTIGELSNNLFAHNLLPTDLPADVLSTGILPADGIVTIVWIVLPFFIGFSSYLFPKLDRFLALMVALASTIYGLYHILYAPNFNLQLLDNFGVTLTVDTLSGYFILTNALVTAAVVLYCWPGKKTAFFFTQLIILHGSVNSAFICADFISLYVALEVISIAAFLLIAYPRTDRSTWVALRYLLVGNTVMLFYLIGAVLVYQASHSFAFVGLKQAPTEAIALIFLGLFTKGGVFVSGLWLPLTHAEADTPVSAMLSGVVVKTGVFALVRCALLVDEVAPLVQFSGIGTAVLGMVGAVFAKDTKRLLAFSSISQLGFVLIAPVAAGFYALTHGLAKAALFLTAGNLPSRDFKTLQSQKIPSSLWLVLVFASLSISGFPLLAGFSAKTLALKGLASWQSTTMIISSVGTAIIFAKFIFLPHSKQLTAIGPNMTITNTENGGGEKPRKDGNYYWLAIIVLISGLFMAKSLLNPAMMVDFTIKDTLKALFTIGAGWLAYLFGVQRLSIRIPQTFEKIDHLIGVMSLILVLLFWSVLA